LNPRHERGPAPRGGWGVGPSSTPVPGGFGPPARPTSIHLSGAIRTKVIPDRPKPDTKRGRRARLSPTGGAHRDIVFGSATPRLKPGPRVRSSTMHAGRGSRARPCGCSPLPSAVPVVKVVPACRPPVAGSTGKITKNSHQETSVAEETVFPKTLHVPVGCRDNRPLIFGAATRRLKPGLARERAVARDFFAYVRATVSDQPRLLGRNHSRPLNVRATVRDQPRLLGRNHPRPLNVRATVSDHPPLLGRNALTASGVPKPIVIANASAYVSWSMCMCPNTQTCAPSIRRTAGGVALQP